MNSLIEGSSQYQQMTMFNKVQLQSKQAEIENVEKEISHLIKSITENVKMLEELRKQQREKIALRSQRNSSKEIELIDFSVLSELPEVSVNLFDTTELFSEAADSFDNDLYQVKDQQNPHLVENIGQVAFGRIEWKKLKKVDFGEKNCFSKEFKINCSKCTTTLMEYQRITFSRNNVNFTQDVRVFLNQVIQNRSIEVKQEDSGIDDILFQNDQLKESFQQPVITTKYIEKSEDVKKTYKMICLKCKTLAICHVKNITNDLTVYESHFF